MTSTTTTDNSSLDIIALPRGDKELATRIATAIVTRTREIAATLDAIKITRRNFASPAVSEAVENATEAAEDIRDRAKKLVRAALEATGGDAVVNQIDPRLITYSTRQDPLSAYSQISDRLKKLKAEIKEYRDAERPAVPVRAVALVIYATDKGAADLAAKIKDGKIAGVQGYKFASDEATEKKVVEMMGAKS